MLVKELLEKFPSIKEMDVNGLEFIQEDDNEDEIKRIIDDFTEMSQDEENEIIETFKKHVPFTVEYNIGNQKGQVEFINRGGIYKTRHQDGDEFRIYSIINDLIYYIADEYKYEEDIYAKKDYKEIMKYFLTLK